MVLPLENLSGDPQQEYFVAGMHDALIGELGQIGALRVISRTSAMRYRDSGKSLPEIARELNVDVVVEGSVLRSNGDVQLRVNLIEARPQERRVWGQEYRRRVHEAPVMHGDIARAIAQSIRVHLTADEDTRLSRPRRVDPATYEAYLRGMYHLNRFTREEVQAGIRHFREAIELNPADPLAHAGLAAAYIRIGHGLAPTAEARQLARGAAERAIRLDPDLAEAHAALATAKLYYERDWEAAEAQFRRAHELNPNLAMNHYHYAWYLALFDRLDEAIEAHERLAAIAPPLRWPLAATCARADRVDCARRIAAELEAGPINSMTALGLAVIYANLGDADRAFHWLDYEPPHAWVPWFRNIPVWSDRIRDDPRFQNFLDRIGLPN